MIRQAIVCGCAAVCAAWAGGGPSAEMLDPVAALEAARLATPERFPDADLVVVDDLERVAYAPDGTAETRYDSFTRVLTERGRRDASVLRIGFHQFYTTVVVERVELWKADGRRVDIDPAPLTRVSIDASQMGQNIYDPGHRILSVGVPGVETGDVMRVRAWRRDVRVRIPDQWYDVCLLEGTAPILRSVYEVRAPAARPLRHKVVRDEVPGTVRYEVEDLPDGRLHRWIARDVPRMFPEPDMPDASAVVQRVLVSTCEDWPSISRWYWNLCRPRLEPKGQEIPQAVRELVAGLEDERARVESLFAFVSQKVRYVGLTPETEAPGYEPHDVDLTFRNRHGVCRDKAALLAAMHRLAGIEGYPVLIHVGPRCDPEVPLPYFNHAISAARLRDGSWLLMDPTDETTRHLLPAHLANRSYLVASPEGEPLRTSPVQPAESNLVRIALDAALDAAGRLRGRAELRFEGVNDNAYRGFFARRKPDERRRFLETAVERALPGVRVQSLELDPADMQDRGRPLIARLQFDAPDLSVRGAGIALVAPPSLAGAFGVMHGALGSAGLERRRYPLVTEYSCGVAERVRLDPGPAFGVALHVPSFEDLDAPGFSWRRRWRVAEGHLEAETEALVRKPELDPAEYAGLKDALRRIEAARRRRAIFDAPPAAEPAPATADAAPPPPEPDAEFVEIVTDYAVEGAGAWTVTNAVTKRILTYAGVKANAELKLPYIEGADRVEILEAEVAEPDGVVRRLDPADVQTMEQGWSADAPRYARGRLRVAPLPAVAVGSTIRFRTVGSYSNRWCFAGVEVLDAFEPVARRMVRVRFPADLPLRVADFAGDAARSCATNDGVVCMEWTATRLPAVPRESAMLPAWIGRPSVWFSAGNWKALGEAWAAELNSAAAAAPEAGRRAAALVERRTGAVARVRAIRDFVATAVRPAGPAPWILPRGSLTPADRTLKEGYGHSADRAALMAAMVSAAGLRPRFLVATTVPAGLGLESPLADAPQPEHCPVVLVVVEDEAGRPLILNDTDQYAEPGATPHEGHAAVDLASGRIVTVEPPAEFRSRTVTSVEIELAADGGARLQRRIEYYGMRHAEFVRRIAEMSPEERRRHHQERVAALAQDAVAEGMTTWRTDAHPAVEEVAVRIADFAPRAEGWMHFWLPAEPPELPGLGPESRVAPLYWPDAARADLEVRVRWPGGVAAIRPAAWEWRLTDGAEVAHHLECSAGMLVWRRSVRLGPAVIPASHYADLLELARRLRHPGAAVVAIRMADTP